MAERPRPARLGDGAGADEMARQTAAGRAPHGAPDVGAGRGEPAGGRPGALPGRRAGRPVRPGAAVPAAVVGGGAVAGAQVTSCCHFFTTRQATRKPTLSALKVTAPGS